MRRNFSGFYCGKNEAKIHALGLLLPAHRMTADGTVAEMWVRTLAGGSLAVGFFNRTETTVKVDYCRRYLGFSSAPQVRDLWLWKELGRQQNVTAELPTCGCVLLKIPP
jgi:alpha-galactosidase